MTNSGHLQGARLVALALLSDVAVRVALAIDRARMHSALSESAELFRLSFEDAPLAMALLDEAGRVLRANRSCAALVGGRGVPVGTVGADLVHVDDAAPVRRAVDVVLSGDRSCVELTVRGRTGAGWARVVMSRIASRSGTRVLVQVQDVTEQRRAEQVLRRLASTDPLTGLANRAQLQASLERMLRARRHGDGAVVVLFCDLDHFKQVNDAHGHAVGDELLVAVSRVLVAQLRSGDVAGRLGGDEFVVLLAAPDGLSGAVATAERLRQALDRPVELSCAVVTPAMSIGVAAADASCSAAELLGRADAALYRAKAVGGGRWEVFAPA